MMISLIGSMHVTGQGAYLAGLWNPQLALGTSSPKISTWDL